MSPKSKPKDYGPVQFLAALSIPRWQFERALKNGLIPPAGSVSRRWPAAVVETTLANLDEITAKLGTQPDVGAGRAAEVLSARFDMEVAPGILWELARMGLIPQVGDYKGYPLYDGRALEAFTDREALEQACINGRLLTRDDVARYLHVRRSDVEHLLRNNWLEPVIWVRGARQRRRERPAVPLFRAADLDALLAHPKIDWDHVRATPDGKPSPLATLPSLRDDNN